MQAGRRKNANLKRCSFTGYRPSRMPFGYDEDDPRCGELKTRLHEQVERLIGMGYAHFLSGGAQGFDMFAAEEVLSLREKYPWIVLEMVSPFDAQASRWDEEHRSRHERLLREADIVTRTGREYSRGAMFRRNRYLADNCDLLLAYYDGQPGGTRMTVEYAKEIGVEILCMAV